MLNFKISKVFSNWFSFYLNYVDLGMNYWRWYHE